MRNRGFSLLEVMVAVAILGLALTAILSAQAGLFSSGTHAQRESQAIGLLRCKMSELEERMLKLGYPEVDTKDDGECCADSNNAADGFNCSWEIQRVELPQPATFSDTNPAGSASSGLFSSIAGGGLPSLPGGLGAGMLMGGGAVPNLPAGAGALGALFGMAGNDAGALQAAGGADGGMHALAASMNAATKGGGIGAIESLAMTLVYPTLKPMLEASIRKVILQVTWREGTQQRDLKVVQYITNPMRGGFMTGPMASGLPLLPGQTGTTPITGGGQQPSTPSMRTPTTVP